MQAKASGGPPSRRRLWSLGTFSIFFFDSGCPRKVINRVVSWVLDPVKRLKTLYICVCLCFARNAIREQGELSALFRDSQKGTEGSPASVIMETDAGSLPGKVGWITYCVL